MSVRPARAEDEEPLLEIDRATWSPYTSPAPGPPEGPFFNERTRPANVVVVEIDGRVAGYGKIEHPTELPASEHVWHVTGLAVDPALEGRGAGHALMEALIGSARERGGRRITLRVFAPNQRAQRLYERLGFEREGVLRGEFRVGDGEYVDDILMALAL
ncbi:MAG TPA: GNAT family N-acetyltransferase [Thermoleophilaceae bacterium]